MDKTSDMFRVGVISSTHGIKGEVKVYPTTDEPKRFSKLKKVYVEFCKKGLRGNSTSELIELEISSVRYFKQFVIVKFKGIDDINDVEKYKGMDLYVTREEAIPLEENEYYIADLIGLKVISDEDREVGILIDVLQTGANDVYEVKANEEFGEKELLLPAIKECIKDINIDEGIMRVQIMEGLLDLWDFTY